jgi:tetratricopeptide (TPR) repeat protein
MGDRGELKNLAEYDAVKLFVSGARRACPGFRLADQATQVSRVCRLVDGMPLAILLASSRVGTLAPAEIAARIAQGLDLLEAGWRDVPQRHRSVRAAFDHSWKLLTEREQEVFGVLSVFQGSFDQKAAQAVSGATTVELWGLIDKSFLHRLPMGRYQVHELLRQYGADRLRQVKTPEEAPVAWEAAHERHCGYYTAALQRWGEDLKGARQQASLAEMDVEIENARAAWSWAAERRQAARLEQALEGLCLFYEWRARYQEGETACRQAVERLARKILDPSLSVLIKLLAWQGAFSRLLERSDSAAQLFAECRELLAHPALAGRDLHWERAFLLFQKAQMALHSDRKEAGRLHGQSAALFRAAGNDWWAATALREQGRAAFYRGLYAEARRLMEQSLVVRRAAGDQRAIAESLDGLGILDMNQGQFEKAVTALRESLAILGRTGCRYDYAGALGNLAFTLAVTDRLEEGHATLEQSIAAFADIGRSWALAHDMAMLGVVKMWLGRYADALAQSDRASALSQEVGYWHGIGLACWVRGGVALARGAYAQAQQWAEECATLSRRIEQRDELPWALGLLGSAQREMGQLSAARQYLQEAIRMAVETKSFSAILVALPMIPPLLADQGQGERAVELYALVLSQIPVVSNSRWFEDVAGRQIASVAESLPPDVVAAAQARGRARDLWAAVTELVDELAD